MDKGNWVPMDKTLVAALPKRRPYSLIEAVFSYQVDLDKGTVKGERAYSRIWSWSRTRVRAFLYQQKTTHDTSKRPLQFRFVQQLQRPKDQQQNHHPDQEKTTTNNPNPSNPNPSKEKDKGTRPSGTRSTSLSLIMR